MANVSAYGAKAMLDWMLGGAAAPTDPAQHWLGLSYGSPTSVSASEVVTPAGTYTRVTFVAGAAASPAGSASNANAVIFAACSYTAAVSGWQLWDTQGVGAGNMLAYGLLSAATQPASGSQFTAAIASCLLTAL